MSKFLDMPLSELCDVLPQEMQAAASRLLRLAAEAGLDPNVDEDLAKCLSRASDALQVASRKVRKNLEGIGELM
jgi:hypothetical protein